MDLIHNVFSEIELLKLLPHLLGSTEFIISNVWADQTTQSLYQKLEQCLSTHEIY